METIQRYLEVFLLLLAIVSGALVGHSVGSVSLTAVAVVGALCGFVLTDRLALFSLDGWLANTASLAILYFVFRDFSSGDQTQKLVAVAQLLVYLQTILMFQPKLPRLVWQVLTLSLLQVSIAAIFTLEFEAGVLFLLYFALASIALVLQTLYVQRRRVDLANKRANSATQAVNARRRESNGAESDWNSHRPIVFQEMKPVELRFVDNRFVQLGLWLAVSFSFAMIAFCVLPRHMSPWYGPAVHQVTTAGMMTAVDLEQRGKVRLSKEIVFRAAFEDQQRQPLKGVGTPYFRAIAFSKLKIEDGRTSFTAPYDRVYPKEVYQMLPRHDGTGRAVRQIITLEKTTDPLVYEVMPVFRTESTPEELEFCHEISAYTRCRDQGRISVAPYKYETGTLVDHRGRFLTSWPYVANTRVYQKDLPLSLDQEYRTWLVQMDRDRYPGLVAVADRIAKESKGSGRLALTQKLTSFFQQPNRFQYTLDFTDVTMDSRIDPIEDFFSNHRQGHCELYAAALTLMLRSLDIPARLVVGFHGSEFNSLTNSYFVRGTDAHAWVEVYLRPEDCTPQMLHDGAAGKGGAWKILDATPDGIATEEAVGGGSAIELARSYWQDYVLGMEGSESSETSTSVPDSLIRLMAALDVEQIDRRLGDMRRLASSPQVRWMALLGVAALVLLRVFAKSAWEAIRRRMQTKSGNGRFASMFADALSMIAPSLGDWVRSVSGGQRSTHFYWQLSQLLAQQGLRRAEQQTHRDFAGDVAKKFSEHRYGKSINQIVFALTEHYNSVRFGQRTLDDTTRAKIGQQLDAIEVALEESPLTSNADLD